MLDWRSFSLPLGIDPVHGGCVKHPTCILITPKPNGTTDSSNTPSRIQTCRICESELSTILHGSWPETDSNSNNNNSAILIARQRKSLAPSIQAIQAIHALPEWKEFSRSYCGGATEGEIDEDTDTQRDAAQSPTAVDPLQVLQQALLRGQQLQDWELLETTMKKMQLESQVAELIRKNKEQAQLIQELQQTVERQQKTISKELKMIKNIAKKRANNAANIPTTTSSSKAHTTGGDPPAKSTPTTSSRIVHASGGVETPDTLTGDASPTLKSPTHLPDPKASSNITSFDEQALGLGKTSTPPPPLSPALVHTGGDELLRNMPGTNDGGSKDRWASKGQEDGKVHEQLLNTIPKSNSQHRQANNRSPKVGTPERPEVRKGRKGVACYPTPPLTEPEAATVTGSSSHSTRIGASSHHAKRGKGPPPLPLPPHGPPKDEVGDYNNDFDHGDSESTSQSLQSTHAPLEGDGESLGTSSSAGARSDEPVLEFVDEEQEAQQVPQPRRRNSSSYPRRRGNSGSRPREYSKRSASYASYMDGKSSKSPGGNGGSADGKGGITGSHASSKAKSSNMEMNRRQSVDITFVPTYAESHVVVVIPDEPPPFIAPTKLSSAAKEQWGSMKDASQAGSDQSASRTSITNHQFSDSQQLLLEASLALNGPLMPTPSTTKFRKSFWKKGPTVGSPITDRKTTDSPVARRPPDLSPLPRGGQRRSALKGTNSLSSNQRDRRGSSPTLTTRTPASPLRAISPLQNMTPLERHLAISNSPYQSKAPSFQSQLKDPGTHRSGSMNDALAGFPEQIPFFQPIALNDDEDDGDDDDENEEGSDEDEDDGDEEEDNNEAELGDHFDDGAASSKLGQYLKFGEYLEVERSFNLSPVSALTTGSYLKEQALAAQGGSEILPRKSLQNADFAKKLPMEDGFDSGDEDESQTLYANRNDKQHEPPAEYVTPAVQRRTSTSEAFGQKKSTSEASDPTLGQLKPVEHAPPAVQRKASKKQKDVYKASAVQGKGSQVKEVQKATPTALSGPSTSHAAESAPSWALDAVLDNTSDELAKYQSKQDQHEHDDDQVSKPQLKQEQQREKVGKKLKQDKLSSPKKAKKSAKSVRHVEADTVSDKYGDAGLYTGSVTTDTSLPHGYGEMKYENERQYAGDWKAGRWHGKGRWSNPNGDVYEGTFDYDARHGEGVYTWKNGNCYKGEFYEDKRQGKGVFHFANGNEYTGDFVDGVFEGSGKYCFDGGEYNGSWVGGRYHGYGTLIFHDGTSYKGEFADGVANGKGEETTVDGNIRRGVWERGRPTKQQSS